MTIVHEQVLDHFYLHYLALFENTFPYSMVYLSSPFRFPAIEGFDHPTQFSVSVSRDETHLIVYYSIGDCVPGYVHLALSDFV